MPLVNHSSYSAPSFLFNAHLQTIIPSIFRKVKGINYVRERISTPDGDFLDLDWSQTGSKKLMIVSHGLEGDTTRPYIKGMVRCFNKHGYDALAWNFRGCSGHINHLPRFYHSGATEDLKRVIESALENKDYEEIYLIGFSLGGNLTLKYLGEFNNALPFQIQKSIVFSVPMDLYHSCLKISERSNKIYSKRFLKNLKTKIISKARLMPDQLSIDPLKLVKTIQDFDDLYTAPLHGFTDAIEYYSKNSSINFIERISIPTLIVNAQNDPFLSKECFPYDKLANHPHVYLETPKEGGHCGFWPSDNVSTFWSEKRAMEFIENN